MHYCIFWKKLSSRALNVTPWASSVRGTIASLLLAKKKSRLPASHLIACNLPIGLVQNQEQMTNSNDVHQNLNRLPDFVALHKALAPILSETRIQFWEVENEFLLLFP